MRPTKAEVMAFLKPEPITKEELDGLEKLQPGDYEICSQRLTMILAECKEVFMKVGNSDWIIGGDLIVGLHTAQGDLVGACLGTFIHSVTAQNPIKWIMHNFTNNPGVGVHEGDIFYASESTYGGIHNCDQLALMPIFHKGELIAWASAGTHIAETGGTMPGGMIAGAKSRYDEGMSLTPIKIAENYRLKDDLVEMMVNFISRAPRQQLLDLKGRVTAADRLRTRIQQLADDKGGDFIRGLLRKVLLVAEEGAKKRINGWHDGIYRNVCFNGGVGPYTGLWRIFCTAYKEGDHILLDYTGTSPETDTAWNCMPWVMVCYAALHMYSHGFWDLPVCSGTLVPVDFKIPDGTIISPNWDAAISMAPPVGELNNELLPKIFACMMFSSDDKYEIAAPINGISGGGMGGGGGMGSGINQWGVPFVSGGGGWTRNTGGQGGRVDSDGMNSAVFRSAVHAPGTDGEETEVNEPVFHLWQKHRKDSCGHGKYRGGASGYVASVVYGVPYVKGGVSRRGTRPGMLVGQGLFGGYPAFATPGAGINRSNLLELLARGEKNIPTSPEEVLMGNVIEEYPEEENRGLLYEGALMGGGSQAGGYGYGDVLERDSQAVVDDIRDEIISDWSAEHVYHVVYDRDTWTADIQKTLELRDREHKDRLQRGISYDKFEEKWLKKRPPEDQMNYYGTWPDARMIRPIIRI
jgi:N-methylhydantoinase B/oxoprolinase/acetone carboxylase alpha subunit